MRHWVVKSSPVLGHIIQLREPMCVCETEKGPVESEPVVSKTDDQFFCILSQHFKVLTQCCTLASMLKLSFWGFWTSALYHTKIFWAVETSWIYYVPELSILLSITDWVVFFWSKGWGFLLKSNDCLFFCFCIHRISLLCIIRS